MKKVVIDILKREIENNFKNDSVFGGISFFIKKIIKNNNDFDDVLLSLIDYDNLNIENRSKVIYSVLSSLDKLPDLGDLHFQKDTVVNNTFGIHDNDLEKLVNDLSFNNLRLSSDLLGSPLEKFMTDLGINKKILTQLRKCGIKTLEDLVWFFPKSYSDRTKSVSILQAIQKEKSYIIVDVISSYQIINPPGKKFKLIKYGVKDEFGYPAELVFFNQDFVIHYIKVGNRLKVFGRVIKNKVYQVLPEEWEFSNRKTLDFDRIVPHYSTSINQKKIREIIYKALKLVYKEISDPLFPFLQRFSNGFNFRFGELSKSVVNIHFPSSFEELDFCRNRVALEEIVYTQILMSSVSKKVATSYRIDKVLGLKHFSELSLPFELTNSQRKVIDEVLNDLSSGSACRRLVQGDVGAGKTIVAIIACYVVSKQGYQSCVMAPTEILATQHYNSFKRMLPGLKIELLTSKIKGKKRKEIIQRLKNGDIDILVGTHALIGENIEFSDLALIVVDEQHKFGVNQRFRLYSKSECPHLIVMSATPIPRTLALTVYSDLDISVIDELPPGRKKAVTEIFNYKDLKKVYGFIEDQLKEGRQAYIICPSIFENPKIELKNVERVYEEASNYFRGYRVACLHGKINNKEKDRIMEDFRQGVFSILVSTTVVEVGIDVPNANVVVIMDSERFGLSQLHQLRGRVKRSSHQPYCFLVTSKSLSYAEFNKSVRRLSILKYYDDGFKVAEKDLELRGPGEVIGYKQHGFTEFKILNPIKDVELIRFSNFLAKSIAKFTDRLEFVKLKIGELSSKIQNISDTI
ncbi:MAG: ATP-dependent DNA helicase RecG [bacterium]|nr:ATP-dependent DNA helicase RecG [bacterium]